MMKFRNAARIAGVGAFVLGVSAASQAIVDEDELNTTNLVEGPVAEHCDDLVNLPKDSPNYFENVFICGDEFFEFDFNAVDGGGANVGDGARYTRVPRADLDGPGEWASHTPTRPTGPNSASCGECHSFPVGTAAGRVGFNVIRDPFHTGDPSLFINRNTPMLMGSGALQILAEEMNAELEGIVQSTIDDACAAQESLVADLTTKGVNFGTVDVRVRPGRGPCPRQVRINAEGVDDDLIVKPFQWKGSDATLRGFTRGAFNGEIGMQPVETTGDGVDGDGDGVADEVSVDDVTATTVYAAGQPRPVTELELNDLRDALEGQTGGAALADELGLPDLEPADITAINLGAAKFTEIECDSCHKPELLADGSVFSEPSLNPNYRDDVFPAGQDPVTEGLDWEDPVAFDLTTDMLDNHIQLGTVDVNVANFLTENGKMKVELFGDLKRHDMGPGLAESIDEVGTGASVWMTKELWGVGSTNQYLHDGRATTLTEAILLHGGEAQDERDAFDALPLADQQNLVRFLQNLVIFKVAEEE